LARIGKAVLLLIHNSVSLNLMFGVSKILLDFIFRCLCTHHKVRVRIGDWFRVSCMKLCIIYSNYCSTNVFNEINTFIQN